MTPHDELTAHELKALDLFFTRQRQRCAETLAREREEHGPLHRRIGELTDQLRRYDTLHARTRSYAGRNSVHIDPRRDDAAALHELKALCRNMA